MDQRPLFLSQADAEVGFDVAADLVKFLVCYVLQPTAAFVDIVKAIGATVGAQKSHEQAFALFLA
jgi:hypothetical protein